MKKQLSEIAHRKFLKNIREDIFHKTYKQHRNKPSRHDSRIYSIECLLIIDKSKKRNKADILSDIRAIEGVTIVTVHEQYEDEKRDFSHITVKVDVSPLPVKSIVKNLIRINKETKHLRGVETFRYKTRPKLI